MITLDCLRALYGFNYTPSAADKNSVALGMHHSGLSPCITVLLKSCPVEYTTQVLIPDDLDVFFNAYSKDQVGTRPNLVSIDGGNFTTGNWSDIEDLKEASLDVQTVMGLLGKSQEVTLYQVGDISGNASFNNFLDAFGFPDDLCFILASCYDHADDVLQFCSMMAQCISYSEAFWFWHVIQRQHLENPSMLINIIQLISSSLVVN